MPVESNDRDEIREILGQITQAWLNDRYEGLEQHFHLDIVIAPPGSEQRIVGRDECIKSYRDFSASAIIQEYEHSEPTIDVWEDTAVATYRFLISYELGGMIQIEREKDGFVFSRQSGKWLAVWRTLLSTGHESSDDT